MVAGEPMPGSDFATVRDFYNNNRTVRARELGDGDWELEDDLAYRTDFFAGGGQTLLNHELEQELIEEEFDY